MAVPCFEGDREPGLQDSNGIDLQRRNLALDGNWFNVATFTGDTAFTTAAFSGGARFDEATFVSVARCVDTRVGEGRDRVDVWMTGWTAENVDDGEWTHLVPVPAVRNSVLGAVSVRGEVEYSEAEWTLVVGEGVVHDGVRGRGFQDVDGRCRVRLRQGTRLPQYHGEEVHTLQRL